MKILNSISLNDALIYECHSSVLTSLIWFSWGQELLSKYLANKVRRKYNQYLISLKKRELVINRLLNKDAKN